jgi:hypothetical protein
MEANLLANICQSMMTWQVDILFCEMSSTPGRPLLQEIVFHNFVISCHAGLPSLLQGVMHALVHTQDLGVHPPFTWHHSMRGVPSAFFLTNYHQIFTLFKGLFIITKEK